MKTSIKLLGAAAALILGAGIFTSGAFSQEGMSRLGPPFMRHGMGMGMMGAGPGMMGAGPGMTRHGMMGMGHDSATMAQLRVIHQLFIDHDRIKRTVTNLSDGIRTTTESDDPQVAQLLKDHFASMRQRLTSGDDPGLPIESQAVHSIFRNYDKINTTLETTPKGIVVTQTSSDQNTVAVLQKHASQVSDFVSEGMIAMRAAMMKNAAGMMHRGMGAP